MGFFDFLFGGGGSSSSTSTVNNITELNTKVNNVIDTSSLAEISKSNALTLNKTLKGFSDATATINKNIADTLLVMAKNSDIDNKRQDTIVKGIAVLASGLFTYLAIKNNRENK